MAQPNYSSPPLAGRPPFATDEPDSMYDQRQPEQTRRLRQQPPANPNARTSAYNVYVLSLSFILGVLRNIGWERAIKHHRVRAGLRVSTLDSLPRSAS